jgi:nitrogen fixation/metabolism regulation signal transduction histidine kinase
VKCTRRLIIAILMNLIDNSIWWLENKGARNKRIFIGTSTDLPGGPAIVVADNGPGFIDPPEYLCRPFFTRRPDGMGLGLHIASEVMKAHGGRLEIPNEDDVEVPEGFDGAVVALVFKP